MTHAPEGADPHVGQRVGSYTLREVIARGGSGRVYLAEADDGSKAAVKVLDPALSDRVDPRRFAREAAIRIEHENVVRVLDAGVADDGSAWLALEYLEGEPLSRRLFRGRLEPAEAVNLGIQVCRGLAVAHARGIVHRDIKPSNLFLCSDGTVKILDFGIALLDPTATRMTTTGKVLGTPGYLSPEQAGGGRDLDHRVDLWGLGAVLYESLTGIQPFERDTLISTIFAIMREDHRPIASLTSVPPSLAAVIERCLAKDRSQRWRDAESLGHALSEVDLDEAPLDPEERSRRTSIAPGEQRVVAILLAEEVRDPIALRRAVEEQGGTFMQIIGDRAVGLFGGSAWEGDELDRAAEAAVAARAAADKVSVAAGRATGEGAGISGAVLRSAEESVRADVDGVALDRNAARVLTQSYGVEPAKEGFWRLAQKIPTTPLPPAHDTMVGIPPFDLAQPAPPMELVGRASELARMKGALRTLLEERRSTAVLLIGPLGIGKSVLRRQMERMLREADADVTFLQARASPVGQKAGLSLLADALRRRARAGTMERGWRRVDPEAPPAERREAILDLGREAIADEEVLADCSPFLGELLGVAMPESTKLTVAQGDSHVMADRLRLAVREYFAGLAAQGPVALSVEDLQWADVASLDVLEDLMVHLEDRPLLLLATARPWLEEVRPGFLAGRKVTVLRPRGLGVADVARLARGVARQDVPPEVVDALVERTGGNPLFVEQIVRELVEIGRLDAPVSELPLPVTVEAAVQSRLDHLPLLEKNLCKRAAVLGRPFTEEEVSGLGVSDARALLESLVRRGVLTSRARERGGRLREYRFRYSLFGDVAYNLLAEDARKGFHRRAAAVLASRKEVDEEEVALHHERAGDVEAAVDCYALAAVTAGRRGDGETVLRCTQKVLDLGPDRHSRYALHEARAHALHFLGRFDEELGELSQALAHAANSPARLRVEVDRVECLWWMGRLREAAREAADVAGRAEPAGDPEANALALARLARALVSSGRVDKAASALAEARATRLELGLPSRAAMATATALIAGARGDLTEASAAHQQAVDLHTAAGDLRRAAAEETALAAIYIRTGALHEAEHALREAVERCREVGHRAGEALAHLHLGAALTALDRPAEARESLMDAARLLQGSSAAGLRLLVRLQDVRARLALGDLQGLASEAEAVAERAEPIPMPELRVRALALAARARLAGGDVAGALDVSERALELYDRLGGLADGEAEVFLARVEALEAADHPAQAESVRERGRARLQEIARRLTDEESRSRFLAGLPARRALLD